MAQPSFFKQPPSSTLADIAALTKAHLADPSHGDRTITGLASLDEAGPMHLTFFDNLKYADQLARTYAGACLVSERFEARVPAHVAVLRVKHPFRAFVDLARELHSDALRPGSSVGNTGIAPSSGPINDCVRAGDHVWMVVLAEDPNTGEITAGDIEAQTRQALSNLRQAVTAAGGNLTDIVQVQIFLVDRADAPGMNRVYAEFFNEKPYPIRATVVVKELLAEGLRIEITATAVIPVVG